MTHPPMSEELAGTHHLHRIRPLLTCPEEQRDLPWLRGALQSAVAVEFSTIPPYLCALWSIEDELDPVAATIRNVVQEEMLHMSMACNMLTAVGGVPRINDPLAVPTYPGKLPGGVHQHLTVELSALTDAALDGFIAIESPTGHGPDDETIGELYDGIWQAFERLEPELSVERQISGPLAHMVMFDLGRVEAAIHVIKTQGEGSSASAEVEHTTELAHYYRFLEVREGRRFSHLDDDGCAVFEGPALPRPACFPMREIPAGGYLQADVPPEVWALVQRFDVHFTRLLDLLQSAWETSDQGAFVHAIGDMFGLTTIARRLMQIPIDDGPQTYGPCFRLLTP